MLRKLCALGAASIAALALASSAFANDRQLSAEMQLPYPFTLASQSTVEGPIHLGTSFSSISTLCYHVIYTDSDWFDPGDLFALDPGGWGRFNAGSTSFPDQLACTNASSVNANQLAEWQTGEIDAFLNEQGGSGRIASVVATVTGTTSSPVGYTGSGTGPATPPVAGGSFQVGASFVPAGDVALPLAVSVTARVSAPGATVSVAGASGSPPFSPTATVQLSPSTPAGTWYVVLTATGGGFTRSVEIPFTVSSTPPPPPADTTPPVVTGTPDRAPNANGWYSGDVTVHWSATDPAPSSGTPTTPADSVLTGEGANVSVTSAPSCDPAGNCSTGSFSASIDRTAPTVAAPSFAANPLRAGASTTVNAAAADGLSGLAGGELFVGTDPGAGNGTPLTLSGGTLSGSVTAPSTPGVYTVGVRSRDRAGNWSATSTAFLVAYDPSAGFVTGGGWVVPGGSSSNGGDVLPGLDGRSKANFGFESRYDDATTSSPRGQFELTYTAGSSRFHVKGSTMTWLVVSGTSSTFEGTAAVDGQTGTYAYRVDVADGSTDHIQVRIWAPGSRIDVDPPLWQASGDVQGSIVIHGTA